MESKNKDYYQKLREKFRLWMQSEEGKNNKWSEPENLGYPLNTTDDDLHYMPINDGKIAYYSLFRKDGYGGFDIYRIEFPE